VFDKIVLLVGVATLAVLLWNIDTVSVGRMVMRVGWGMPLIIGQDAVAHLVNTLAWRFSFPPNEARYYPLAELFKLRIAGDAVNYLTPSGMVTGEIARIRMMNDSLPVEVRAASVATAALSQALAQALFVIVGLLVVAGHLPPALRDRAEPWLIGLLLALLAIFAGYALRGREWIAPSRQAPPAGPFARLRSVAGPLRHYFRNHPWRLGISIALFAAGYAWGWLEAFWICRFIGVRLAFGMALTIQVLSVGFDGIIFMIPAKLGTQEGGRAAIFSLLGLEAASGFAFGVVRHIRELAWASAGFVLYSLRRGTTMTSPSMGEASASNGERTCRVP